MYWVTHKSTRVFDFPSRNIYWGLYVVKLVFSEFIVVFIRLNYQLCCIEFNLFVQRETQLCTMKSQETSLTSSWGLLVGCCLMCSSNYVRALRVRHRSCTQTRVRYRLMYVQRWWLIFKWCTCVVLVRSRWSVSDLHDFPTWCIRV